LAFPVILRVGYMNLITGRLCRYLMACTNHFLMGALTIAGCCLVAGFLVLKPSDLPIEWRNVQDAQAALYGAMLITDLFTMTFSVASFRSPVGCMLFPSRLAASLHCINAKRDTPEA
jgi:hypothetical protein